MNPSTEKEFTLEDLPLEILLNIVGLLGRKDLISMTRVSRKLREISRDPQFWNRIQVNLGKNSVNYVKLLSVHCTPLLQELSFCSNFAFDEEGESLELIRLFTDNTFLQKLDLGNLKVNDEMAELITNSFHQLKELRINEGYGMHGGGLIYIAKLESLEKLYLLDTSFTYLDAGDFKIIAENFRNIQELGLYLLIEDLTSCTNDAFILILESHGDKLKQLSLSARFGLSKFGYEKIAECKKLEVLNLVQTDMDDSILASLQNLASLRSLKFDGEYSYVSSAGLIKFFNESASLLRLERLELTLTKMCAGSLASIAKNCTNLRHLALTRNFYLCGKACFGIILDNLKHLESLDLRDVYIPINRLLDIPTQLPKLRKLDVVCPLEDDAVKRLKELAPLLEVGISWEDVELEDVCNYFDNNKWLYSHSF